MQISAARIANTPLPLEPQAPASSAAEAQVPKPADPVDVRRVASLLVMLENKPEVRAEVVARGRALASDPNYPQPDVINKLAGMVIGNGQ